jgi:omega-6 fatty acid desaturase (delta-12 desaturase)
MVMFRPGRDTARKHHFGISRAITATFAVGLATGAWFAGGVWAAVAAVLVPFAVFTTVIALFVYLHHTHPRLPFFDDRQRWNAATGQVACSTIVRLSAPANLLTHSIMVHTPHHVDTRIPFYRLQQAYADLAPTYGDLIVEYDFHWKTVSGIFSTCKVFDFDKQVWYRFADLKVLTIEPVAAKPASAPASVDA